VTASWSFIPQLHYVRFTFVLTSFQARS